ncbi:outer membrane protein transport protein [Prolixibacteraceae bacterium]|nr:outer membrane protein transport protein [Prolixibacteraceae bacterium]
MSKNIYIVAVLFLGIIHLSYGQLVDDIPRYNKENYAVTARSAGMGGAFGALGGDLSSILINPAGIAVFQSSEFSSTIGLFNNTKANTNYGGQHSEMDDSYVNIPNFGFVSVIPNSIGSSSLVNFNWGITYNRTQDFQRISTAELGNTTSSRTQAYATEASRHNLGLDDVRFYDDQNGYSVNPYYGRAPVNSVLAFQGYLMYEEEKDGNPIDGVWYSVHPKNGTVRQEVTRITDGSINNYSISLGGNINHKLYFGLSVDLKDYTYNEERRHKEFGHNTNIHYFDHREYTSTDAFGYGLNLGIIYRPVPFLRVGAAIHTPTYYNVNEKYSASMSSVVDYDGVERRVDNESSPTYEADFKVQTPMRYDISLALILGKALILSGDYEYQDYGSSRFNVDGNNVENFDFTQTNKDISAIYEGVHALRLGIEGRIQRHYYLRTGAQYYSSPFKAYVPGLTTSNGEPQIASNDSHYVLSGGLGYRNKNFFIDVAYTYDYQDNNYYQYVEQFENFYMESPKTQTDWTKHTLLVSLGVKF